MEQKAPTFDVIQWRKRITLFKLGKSWVINHFFDNKETFKALAENYNEDKFRFEFKTLGEMNKAFMILDRTGLLCNLDARLILFFKVLHVFALRQ